VLVPCLTSPVTGVNVSGSRYRCDVVLVPDGDSDLAARLPHHLVRDRCSMSDGTCSSGDCPNAAHARGLCTGHYKRLAAGLSIDAPLRVRRRSDEPAAPCSIDECGESARKGGLCSGHYQRHRSGIPIDGPLRAKRKNGEAPAPCSFPECGRPVKYKQLCKTHYECQRMGLPLVPIHDLMPRTGTCAVDACDREIWARGLCAADYVRVYLVESGKGVEYAATRRSRMFDGPHEHITAADYRALRAATDDCYLCGEPLADPVEFDHVIPLARGGRHVLANIKPTHQRCNRVKGASLPDEFAQALVREEVMN
jgi:HNH endonuclease